MAKTISITSRALIHRLRGLVDTTMAKVLVATGPRGTSIVLEGYGMTGEITLDDRPRGHGCRVLPDLVLTAAAEHVAAGGSAALEVEMSEGIVDVGLGNRGFIEPMPAAPLPMGCWDVVQVKAGMPVMANDDLMTELGSFPGYLVMADRGGIHFRGLGRKTVDRDQVLPTAQLPGRGLTPARLVVDGPSLVAAFASTANTAAPRWATVVSGHSSPVLGIAAGGLAFAIPAGTPPGLDFTG